MCIQTAFSNASVGRGDVVRVERRYGFRELRGKGAPEASAAPGAKSNNVLYPVVVSNRGERTAAREWSPARPLTAFCPFWAVSVKNR